MYLRCRPLFGVQSPDLKGVVTESNFFFDKISVFISGIGQTFRVLSKALISELLFGSCVVALSSVSGV